MTFSPLVNMPFGLSFSPLLLGFSESYGIFKESHLCFKKKEKEKKTTKLIHVGRLDKVIHFVPKEEKKSLAFSQVLYISSVFFQVCLWDCTPQTMLRKADQRMRTKSLSRHKGVGRREDAETWQVIPSAPCFS